MINTLIILSIILLYVAVFMIYGGPKKEVKRGPQAVIKFQTNKTKKR